MKKYNGYILFQKDNKWQYEQHTSSLFDLATIAQRLNGKVYFYEPKGECEARNKGFYNNGN